MKSLNVKNNANAYLNQLYYTMPKNQPCQKQISRNMKKKIDTIWNRIGTDFRARGITRQDIDHAIRDVRAKKRTQKESQ